MNSQLEKANKYYKSSQEVRECTRRGARGGNKSKRELLEKALVIYLFELENVTELGRSSLCKNIGNASLKLAETLNSKLDLKLIFYHLVEAVKHFTLAWIERQQQDRKSEWGDNIEDKISECFQIAFRSIDGDVEAERIPNFHLLDKIFEAIGPDVNLDYFRAQFRLAKGQYFYKCGVKTFEVLNFKITDRVLEYCREEIEGTRKLWEKYDKHNDIAKLEEDLNFIRCSCDSVRLRFQADEMFSKHVFDSEETDFGMIWVILDLYKSASLSCREKDLENEAIALSRQGRVFDKILKLKIPAKKYFKKAFDLGISLLPRDLSRAQWFQECKFALERYQKESYAEENKKLEEERKPFLEELKEDLNALEKFASSSLEDHIEFLKFVYTTHPSKSAPSFKFDESKANGSNIKKVLMKAIFNYHPDKQVKFDKKWQVFCEEITKFLTIRYEAYKLT